MDWQLWVAAYLFVGMIVMFIVLSLEGEDPDGILMVACLTGWPFILIGYAGMALEYYVIDQIYFLFKRTRRG